MKIYNADIRLITENLIYFEEVDEGITYDPDSLIRELKKITSLKNRRVICRDEFGNCDELILDTDGQFERFQLLPDDDPVIYSINSYFAERE